MKVSRNLSIFASLKNKVRYISLVMSGIFLVTFLPFNAFHHHESDLHRFALSTGHKDKHSCSLDEHLCDGEFTGSCEHDAHIGSPVPECFSCDFHFIKTFHKTASLYSHSPVSSYHLFASPSYTLNKKQIQRAANKGPPVV